MKKQTIVNIVIVVTVLFLTAVIVFSKTPKKQFSYGVSTPKQVQQKFERHAIKGMLDVLSMAHFAGRIEEAMKCSCAEVVTTQEKDRIQVEILYDKCEEKNNGDN